MGAPWPEHPVGVSTANTAAKGIEERRKDHWAWQAPKQAAPPAVKNPEWARSPLDRFILAETGREGFEPGAPGRSLYAHPAGLFRTHRTSTKAGGCRSLRQRSVRYCSFGRLSINSWLRPNSVNDGAGIGSIPRISPIRWISVEEFRQSTRGDIAITSSILQPRQTVQPVRRRAGRGRSSALYNERDSRRSQLIATGFLSLGPGPL